MFDAGKLLQDFSDAEAIALASIIVEQSPDLANDLDYLRKAVNNATDIVEQDFGHYSAINNPQGDVNAARRQLDSILKLSLECGEGVPSTLRCNTAFIDVARATALALYDANTHQGKFVGDPNQLREAISSFAIILAAPALKLV